MLDESAKLTCIANQNEHDDDDDAIEVRTKRRRCFYTVPSIWFIAKVTRARFISFVSVESETESHDFNIYSLKN